MSKPITRKLSNAIQQRAIEGAIRSILLLHPEYDRPGRVDVNIQIIPKSNGKFLHIQECYQMP